MRWLYLLITKHLCKIYLNNLVTNHLHTSHCSFVSSNRRYVDMAFYTYGTYTFCLLSRGKWNQGKQLSGWIFIVTLTLEKYQSLECGIFRRRQFLWYWMTMKTFLRGLFYFFYDWGDGRGGGVLGSLGGLVFQKRIRPKKPDIKNMDTNNQFRLLSQSQIKWNDDCLLVTLNDMIIFSL